MHTGPVLDNTVLKMQPVYPPVARAAHVEGKVLLHAIIDQDGAVESLDVISGPALLQGAAVNAVKQWKYRPYLIDGVARKVDTKVTVNFQLSKPK